MTRANMTRVRLTSAKPTSAKWTNAKLTSVKHSGLTLVELLVSLALGSIIIAGLSGVMLQTINTYDAIDEKNKLTSDARFAMDRMVKAVSYSRVLLLPLNDKPSSAWLENEREQLVPAVTPTDSSTRHTAVLAVSLPEHLDLNGDGIADADDDGDGFIDEDLPSDIHADNASGIYLLDDNGDGSADEFSADDDDETADDANDDPIDGVDNDNDNNIDEDPGSDMNGDGCPGLCGVDDDGDGAIDEGDAADDDEDGTIDDDPYNPLVFFLEGNTLKERVPVPWDADGNGANDGRDFVVTDIADNVTRFRVVRVQSTGGGGQLIELALALTSPVNQAVVSLQTSVRLGGAL